jgi:hypothetical protein
MIMRIGRLGKFSSALPASGAASHIKHAPIRRPMRLILMKRALPCFFGAVATLGFHDRMHTIGVIGKTSSRSPEFRRTSSQPAAPTSNTSPS